MRSLFRTFYICLLLLTITFYLHKTILCLHKDTQTRTQVMYSLLLLIPFKHVTKPKKNKEQKCEQKLKSTHYCNFRQKNILFLYSLLERKL